MPGAPHHKIIRAIALSMQSAALVYFLAFIQPTRAEACRQPATILRASNADGAILRAPIDGTDIVRLAGIDHPLPPDTAESVSLEDEAKATLSQLVEGRSVCLTLNDVRMACGSKASCCVSDLRACG